MRWGLEEDQSRSEERRIRPQRDWSRRAFGPRLSREHVIQKKIHPQMRKRRKEDTKSVSKDRGGFAFDRD